jgi:hypothetical protein
MNGGRMLLAASAWLAGAPAFAQDGIAQPAVPTCRVMMNGKAGPEFVVRPCPQQTPIYAETQAVAPAVQPTTAHPTVSPPAADRPTSPTPAEPRDESVRPTRTERPAKLS